VTAHTSACHAWRRRLVCDKGYTLVELLTVLVILGVVLAGLTAMFHSGMRAEIRANKELDAQQNARAALDRMRRELHCANAVTAPDGTALPDGTPVSSITATLPPACPGSETTVTYATSSVAANRWELTRAADAGTPVRVADYLTAIAPATSSTPFTYFAPGSGTLGRLRVDIPVNLDPADAGTLWRLQDDIVLRNTTRL
jgi:prepilin-type N-terminal cleavage/methylation domain-containing protein